MRLPRFTRKQRILRNLLLMALFLYWAAWCLEFPCLTKNGLLRRAEDAYLLEKGDMELLFDGREIEEESLYAAYGRQLLLFTPSHSECRERRWIPAASPLPMSGSLPPVKTVKRKAGGGAAVGGLSLELQRRMETI